MSMTIIRKCVLHPIFCRTGTLHIILVVGDQYTAARLRDHVLSNLIKVLNRKQPAAQPESGRLLRPCVEQFDQGGIVVAQVPAPTKPCIKELTSKPLGTLPKQMIDVMEVGEMWQLNLELLPPQPSWKSGQ